jgi:hypothetical protein
VSDQSKILWAVSGALLLILGLLFLPGRVQRELRPEPVRAFVAIQVAGDDFATEGRVEIEAGTTFRLHAVLEAAGRSGRRVFFTEAPGLVLGSEPVPEQDLRSWPGPEKAKVLWFSVEGSRPFVELAEDARLESFTFHEMFRPDWPRAWSIPGSLLPAREAASGAYGRPTGLSFGVQRYHVRIELFGRASALVPVATYSSLSAHDLPASAARFPTVISSLDGELALPSRLFGQSQVDLPGVALQREAATLEEWFEADLVFSYVSALRGMLDRAGVAWEDLEWRSIDLAAGPPWSSASVAAGGLLRAGERVVVLYEDRGEPGVLDYEDLCFDFREGAKVVRLSEVFSGEGLVEGTMLRRGGPEEIAG